MPVAPREIQLVNPALVDIVNALPIPHQVEQLDGELLPEDQAALSVGLRRAILELLVFEAQVVLHDVPSHRLFEVRAEFGVDGLIDLPDALDGLPPG